jgi:NitT/TauT family transport system permease protein
MRLTKSEAVIALAGLLIWPFLILLNVTLPDAANRPNQPKEVFNSIIMIFTLILLSYLVFGILLKKQPKARVITVMNAALVFGVFFFLWLVVVGKIGKLNTHSFPSPNTVFDVFYSDFYFLTYKSSRDSIFRAFAGYFLALITGIPGGIWFGRTMRRFEVAYPLAKVTAHVPPVVYLPYAIAVFPSISHAIIFMVYIGAFWPIFINTLFGVYNVDRRYIEFAKILGASEKRILRRIIIPSAMPTILAGCLIGLVLAFVLLTAGEMVGAHTGLGFYLMYHTDIGYFDKVVAAILLISFWVFFWITFGFDMVQARLLRWMRRI